jgi:hypothetical protein
MTDLVFGSAQEPAAELERDRVSGSATVGVILGVNVGHMGAAKVILLLSLLSVPVCPMLRCPCVRWLQRDPGMSQADPEVASSSNSSSRSALRQ